ncbi:MAG: hypothetical protein HWE39_13890 [Oceanospirillaceae bacterium]|nr:hypothetical protein [Oceanospirillaceae bacterium]
MTRYVLLITSLPHPGPLFGARQTPLSRLRLEQHLQLLEAGDRQRLDRIESLLHWDRLPFDTTDAEILQQARHLIPTLGDTRLQTIVEQRLELRTLIAALRRRHRGEPAPPLDGHCNWGYGRWTGAIARYWQEPGFRLQGLYPWLPEAEKLLTDDDPLGLERLLLAQVWRQLDRAGEEHWFDFVAVVVYVLRWNLIDRWVRYSETVATQRFDALTEAGLDRFADLFSGY